MIIAGSDTARPTTIMAGTRNLSTCDLSTARWLGGNEEKLDDRAMAKMFKNEGNLLLADGSATQSNDADLKATGKLVRKHIGSSGGISKGPASTEVWGCDENNLEVAVAEGRSKNRLWSQWGRYHMVKGYVVEYEKGNFEIVMKGGLSWDEAKDAAKKKGGNLATFQGGEYNIFLAQAEAFSKQYETKNPKSQSDLWWFIGMRYKGANPVPKVDLEKPLPGWKWLDGSEVNTSLWACVRRRGSKDPYRNEGNNPHKGRHNQNYGAFWQPINEPFAESKN